jgi:hypothetical protein
MAKLSLCQRFIDGLQYYNLTLKDLEDNYKYAGGDYDEHNRYFILCFREDQRPEHSSHCVCSQYISRNAYITDGHRFIVVGSCCINRFVPRDKRRRTCEMCGAPHQNRVVNRCKVCRVGRCDKCGDTCLHTCKMCYNCKIGNYKTECETCGELHLNKIVNRCDTCRPHLRCDGLRRLGVCDECGKKCRPCFEKCYTCAYLKK